MQATEKIQELQILEKNLQNLAMQKQAFQLESTESQNALEEIKKTSSDIFKVVGSIMLKAEKDETIKELEEKINLLNLRNSSIEKQEALIENKAEELKSEIKKIIDSEK
ncbi:hypothetical protein AUJ84_02790 [Candidatus Pacearchaeota archaeon CG1_02_32_132]|nr:MAG: hypothetical protein AUJ84_02790 [Candidatus Pacearchaeota archaeon CG1_02_32_132]